MLQTFGGACSRTAAAAAAAVTWQQQQPTWKIRTMASVSTAFKQAVMSARSTTSSLHSSHQQQHQQQALLSVSASMTETLLPPASARLSSLSPSSSPSSPLSSSWSSTPSAEGTNVSVGAAAAAGAAAILNIGRSIGSITKLAALVAPGRQSTSATDTVIVGNSSNSSNGEHVLDNRAFGGAWLPVDCTTPLAVVSTACDSQREALFEVGETPFSIRGHGGRAVIA
mmetsp:Transcript_18427/g.39406  ORF Transcript_18427/g.39406 Transcript_18427/m.39406 type:complete len:226 (+) Transcript_18427:434-1111(+)